MGGVAFFIIPTCVQYVAVRPPPGPRSAGFNPAAAGGRYDRRQPAVSDPARTYLAAVIRSLFYDLYRP